MSVWAAGGGARGAGRGARAASFGIPSNLVRIATRPKSWPKSSQNSVTFGTKVFGTENLVPKASKKRLFWSVLQRFVAILAKFDGL